MKVERTVKIDVNTFKVGDIIKFKLTDGTKVKAIAVQKEAGFGENRYGEYESPNVKQWKPMKKRKNRMAFDGSKEENLQWYWLMNKLRESATGFSGVSCNGRADGNSASSSFGVRPVFKIKNL